MKRYLAALLCLVLVVTLSTATVLADDSGSSESSSAQPGNAGGDAWEPPETQAPAVMSGAPTGPIGVGDSFTVTPNPDTRTGSAGWTWDSAYFSATFNSPATFTALKEGASTITYTGSNGVQTSFHVVVNAPKSEPEPEPQPEDETSKPNPATGR